MSQNPVSIVLIDDHPIVRSGLRALIEERGAYKVAAEFSNGWEFTKAAPAMTEPGLIVMDMHMPEMNGLETMRWLRENRPEWKVLILTLQTDDKVIIELFRFGVRGYLNKNCSADVLKKAIDNTLTTGYYHSDLLHHALAAGTDKNHSNTSIMDRITDRELLFLRLICDEHEYTYDEVKDIMNVHRRTVDGYRESLFEKFSIKSKTGLVLFAIKHALVQL